MTTPMPRPTGPGMPTPGANEPRPGVPLPGQHLAGAPGRPEPADPERIRSEIDGLLTELNTRTSWPGSNRVDDGGAETGADITRRARILEQAHDVLVQALATVDKI